MAGEPARRRDGTLVTERSPARGVTRTAPPFQKGNKVAVRHGAFSKEAIAERAVEVRGLLEEVAPELSMPLFADAVQRYCEAEARSRMIGDYIQQVVETEGVPAVPPYLWEQASKATGLAAKLGADCGLDAAGLARISRDLGLVNSARRQLVRDQGPVLGEEGRALRLQRGRASAD